MATRPRLPADFDLPAEVNGWHYDPETGKNAHAWYAADRTASVGVFCSIDAVRVKVADERAIGSARSIEIYREELPEPLSRDRGRKAVRVASGVEAALEWMQSTATDEWTHPEVCEAVFDEPPGFELEQYLLGERSTEIYYRREGADGASRLSGAQPEEYTLDTCPYLYVHVWNGSGDATVALAPWLRAHGPGSKHWEVEPVAETPEDCGLEVALTVAHNWAAEQLGIETDHLGGQQDLAGWSA